MFFKIQQKPSNVLLSTLDGQFVEKFTGAHTEGEIKVLVELVQKLAGSKGAALSRTPQSEKLHILRSVSRR